MGRHDNDKRPTRRRAMEAIYLYSKEFDVQIFSSRSGQEGGIEAMRTWVDYYYELWHDGYKRDHPSLELPDEAPVSFPDSKPAAFVGIDDRVITFTGMWPTVKDLVEFKPWNKRET